MGGFGPRRRDSRQYRQGVSGGAPERVRKVDPRRLHALACWHDSLCVRTNPARCQRQIRSLDLSRLDYEVIAANEVWYQQQLRAGPQSKELQIEEAQALLEIDAQYTIDKSNCYLSG